MAWEGREIYIGPPKGVNPVGQMRFRIKKQTNKHLPENGQRPGHEIRGVLLMEDHAVILILDE